MIRTAVAVALVAAACGTGSSDVEAPPLVTAPTTSAGSTASTSDAAAPTVVTIEQVDCPAELRGETTACGVATVPLDRSDPASGTTVITVSTVSGYDPSFTEPVAVMQGGPGGASYDLASWFPRQPFTQVFVDQRGAGFAGPDLDCVEFDQRIPELLAMPSTEANAAALDAYGACARRLAADPVVGSASSENHAADVVDVMRALGYGRWLAYGVSYGATIGLELLRDEPDGLVGVVLDGVYPPELDVDAGLAYSAERALDELSAACAADVACSSWTADVEGLVGELMAELDREPITVPLRGTDIGTDVDVDLLLDGGRLAEFTFVLLYSELRMRFLPGAFAGIAEGDERAVEWLARNGARVFVLSQAANDEGTWFAVQCHDRLPFTDGAPDDLGPFAASIASAQLVDACAAWDREPAPAEAAEPVSSDLPTLLLSGRFDPITPPPYAEDAASRLGAATVVEQDGRGHGIWYGDECIAGIVQRFVADPTRVLDTSCAEVGPEIDWARP